MPLEKYYDAWGWDKSPNLDDIYKNDEDLLRLFRFRDNLVKDTVFWLKKPANYKGILFSGLPGVGKTTFLKYLEKKHFPSYMKVISLAGRLGAVKPRGYIRVTNEQFIYIFSEIESFLNCIIRENNLGEIDDKESIIRSKWLGSETDLPFEEFTRDILLPRCDKIKKHNGSIPQYYLAIDDVDYIYPTDQTEILAILCDIISSTTNPIILYSARPAAAGIAKNHLLTYESHHFSDPVDVDPINAFEVLKSRLSECNVNCKDSCGPINYTKEVEDVFISLSNNNIRAAQDLCLCAIRNAPYILPKPENKYGKEDLIRAFFGRPSISSKDEKDIDNDRHIQNIFRSITPSDELPFEYITLLSFSDPLLVNENYTQYFNNLCSRFNPVAFTQKRITDKEIISLVASAHDHAFLSRIDKVKLESLTNDSGESDLPNGIWQNKFCLTPKGKFILELTNEDFFKTMCSLESWRPLITGKIKTQHIKVNTIEKFFKKE